MRYFDIGHFPWTVLPSYARLTSVGISTPSLCFYHVSPSPPLDRYISLRHFIFPAEGISVLRVCIPSCSVLWYRFLFPRHFNFLAEGIGDPRVYFPRRSVSRYCFFHCHFIFLAEDICVLRVYIDGVQYLGTDFLRSSTSEY